MTCVGGIILLYCFLHTAAFHCFSDGNMDSVLVVLWGCVHGADQLLFDAGFFTYKAGVVGKTSLALFRELSGGGKEKA